MSESTDMAAECEYGRCPPCGGWLDLESAECPHGCPKVGGGLPERSSPGCLPLTCGVLVGELLAALLLAITCGA